MSSGTSGEGKENGTPTRAASASPTVRALRLSLTCLVVGAEQDMLGVTRMRRGAARHDSQEHHEPAVGVAVPGRLDGDGRGAQRAEP
jgi:hypothetical protein